MLKASQNFDASSHFLTPNVAPYILLPGPSGPLAPPLGAPELHTPRRKTLLMNVLIVKATIKSLFFPLKKIKNAGPVTTWSD